jgi:curli production assembly/transport component CsgF
LSFAAVMRGDAMLKKSVANWCGSCSGVAVGLVAVAAWGVVPNAVAGELVYVPTNPTFGGNPNNAAGLMAAAAAQNDYKAPEKTAAERFASSLQSSILSRLTRNAMDQLFDDNDQPRVGEKVTAGDFTVEFKEEGGELKLIVIDASNGGAASVISIGKGAQ